MTVLHTSRRGLRSRSRGHAVATHARGAAGGEPTLAAVVAGAWEGLAVRGAAPCPVCVRGVLRARYGPGSVPVAGSCTSCGSAVE